MFATIEKKKKKKVDLGWIIEVCSFGLFSAIYLLHCHLFDQYPSLPFPSILPNPMPLKPVLTSHVSESYHFGTTPFLSDPIHPSLAVIRCEYISSPFYSNFFSVLAFSLFVCQNVRNGAFISYLIWHHLFPSLVCL